MGGACSVYGRGKSRVQGFWWEKLWEREGLVDSGVEGRIILTRIIRMRSMNWIELAKNGNRRRALVNAVINLQVPYTVVNFLPSFIPVGFSRRNLPHGLST
jgi:hypothetical protein